MPEDRLTVVGGTDAGDKLQPFEPHVPTEAQRATVRTYVTAGSPHKTIAADLGISVNTLRKYYMREIIESDAKVQARIGQTTLKEALGYPAEYDEKGNVIRAEQKPNPTLLMFLCKARLGFRDYGPTENGQTPDDNGLEFNTAGLTAAERSQRVASLFFSAGTRRAGRAADSASPLGAVPE